VVSRYFLGNTPAFPVPEYQLVSPFELGPYMLVGVVAGLIGTLFVRTLYATEATWQVWQAVARWRQAGLPGYCTLDAGANPHVICETPIADALAARLADLPAVRRLWRSPVAPLGARILDPA